MASQLPTTLPTNNAIQQQQHHQNNLIQQQHQVVSDNSGDMSYQSNNTSPQNNIGSSVIILPPINAVPASSYGGLTTGGLQVTINFLFVKKNYFTLQQLIVQLKNIF